MPRKIALVGDVHGDIESLFDLMDGFDNWIQLGDLGWGHVEVPEFPDGGKALRGNHDHPEIAEQHPSYLGDYGVTDDGIFYISGAKSPDFDVIRRINEQSHDASWIEKEELSYEQLGNAVAFYEETKPDIVISHDAPFMLYQALIGATQSLYPGASGEIYKNSTAVAFDRMLQIHRPRFWYFAHWHLTWAMGIQNTWFRCVNINDFVLTGNE